MRFRSSAKKALLMIMAKINSEAVQNTLISQRGAACVCSLFHCSIEGAQKGVWLRYFYSSRQDETFPYLSRIRTTKKETA